MLRGRGLSAGDVSASGAVPGMLPGPVGARVAVISHGFWQRQLAGRDDAIGRTIEIQGAPFTIVGITAPDFRGFEPGRVVAVTLPLSTQPAELPGIPLLRGNPDARWLRLLGRVRDGIPVESAAAELRGIWRRYLDQYRPSGTPGELAVLPGAHGLNDLGATYRRSLGAMMAGVGVLLLIACANLAGLLLARARTRQHEIGVRGRRAAARRSRPGPNGRISCGCC